MKILSLHVAWTLLLALSLSGCGRESAPVDARLIILGFDGMDPRLAQQWMDDGSLTHFSRLAGQGLFRPLATSNPPQSPVAWASFATGSGPGEHGIYDFLRRDPATYQPALSISETVPPSKVLKLFGLTLPLDDGAILNRRVSTPFWMDVEKAGGRATVLRVPVTFPPDPVHRMLSGMGVPDLLGSQGTYTMFATHPLPAASTRRTRTVRIRPDRAGHIDSWLEGPVHPLKPAAGPLKTALSIDPAERGATIRLGDGVAELAPGEWSGWITVDFSYFGPASVSGIVRVLLVSGYPRVELYVSPIHIDPRAPVVPLSHPPEYAEQLAQRFGLFHTIGMPEETWSLIEGHISDEAWLEMVKTTLKEREEVFYDALDRHDSDVVAGVFVHTDRVSHMFYRGIDERHPLHSQTGPQAREAIHWIYREADRILGETMSRMGPKDRLIVLSDHGFAPFRRAVNLNRWLVDQGLMALKDGSPDSPPGFANVDWSRSRAYALGLNGLYLNRRGRESQGIVGDGEAAEIKRRIMRELPRLEDPRDGGPVVLEVFDGAALYPGNANGDAPDLVVGYAPGFRASWQTTLGGVPAPVVVDNARKWSGDHCIAPAAVPGVLFMSFKPESPIEAVGDVARYVRDHWQKGLSSSAP